MSNNSINKLKAAGYETSRSDQIAVDPAALMLPPPGHPLHDETALNKGLVQAILRDGQRVPVLVVQDGTLPNGAPRLIIVDGRHRYVAIDYINKSYKPTEEGDLPKPEGLVKVKYTIVKGTTLDLVQLSIVANEDRVNHSIRSAAMKYASYIHQAALEGIEESTARARLIKAAGVAWTTTERWSKFLSLDKKVQDQIDSGALPVSAIDEFCQLSREEQASSLAAVAGLVATKDVKKGGKAPKATAAEVAAVVKAARSGKQLDTVEISGRRPGKAKLEEIQQLLQTAIKDHRGEDAAMLRGMSEAIRFVLGYEVQSKDAKRLWSAAIDGDSDE